MKLLIAARRASGIAVFLVPVLIFALCCYLGFYFATQADQHERAKWTEVPATITALGPVSGADEWTAFREVTVSYLHAPPAQAAASALVPYDESMTVGQPSQVWVNAKGDALYAIRGESPGQSANAPLFLILGVFVGFVLGLALGILILVYGFLPLAEKIDDREKNQRPGLAPKLRAA
jgi:hypothetical protein